MISSFSAHPKAQNKNSKIIMVAFLILAAIAIVVSMLMKKYTWVASMVALASITTAILMYTKYVSVTFFYDILADDGDDEPVFVVRQRIGKRDVTMCRVPLADIISIKKETKAERKAHKKPSGVNLFVYAPTLSPDVSYRIFVSNRYEKSEVVLEGSDEFFDMLKRYAEEAREIRASLEE